MTRSGPGISRGVSLPLGTRNRMRRDVGKQTDEARVHRLARRALGLKRGPAGDISRSYTCIVRSIIRATE